MTLAEIFAALDPDRPARDAFSAGADPIAVRSALALLTPMLGLPLAAICLQPPTFSIRFPKHAVPDEAARVFGYELSRYRAWRRIVLDAQMLATRRVVDDDLWDALRRVARLLLGDNEAASLYALSSRMPGLTPRDLTLGRIVAMQEKLTGHDRQSVRRACSILDRLHDHELAVALCILPPRLGLPRMPRLRPHLPLPPRLAAFATGAGIEPAATHCWTLAVRAGLLDADADPDAASAFPPAVWSKIWATDPRAHGVDLSPGTLDIYRQRLARALVVAGAPDPTFDPVAVSWSALKSAVRKSGRSAAPLSHLSVSATRGGFRPCDLTPDWIAALLACTKDRKVEAAIRSACFLLDALHGDARIPADLLPGRPTGIVRRRARKTAQTAAPAPASDPVRQAWTDFLSEARAAGVSEDQLTPVIRIEKRAERRQLRPADLDVLALEELGRRSTRAERAAVAEALDALRRRPALVRHLAPEPVGPIGACQPGRGLAAQVPEIAAEVDALLAELGAAESTKRGARAAVAALCRAAVAGDLPFGSLDDLLRLTPDTLDWGRDAERAAAHRRAIGGLRAFRFLPWTPRWRALQRAVVDVGVPMVENPVPDLVAVADGREPAELDGAWARSIDRRHRTAGRADLARTFEAKLARLDRLHAIPAIAETGLLPPVFGPLRERTELLPLPPQLAALAEAHGCVPAAAMVWTAGVRVGLFAAADDPAMAALASPAIWRGLRAIDPSNHGLRIAQETFEGHCRKVVRLLETVGFGDPCRSATDRAWASLAAAVRKTGRRADVLSMIAVAAKAEGLGPADLTPVWFAALLARTPEPALKPTRSACYLLDEFHGDARIPPELLPPAGTGVVRLYAKGSQV